MAVWAFCFLSLALSSMSPYRVSGRLTEFMTERLPILSDNLHEANIDLKALSKRASLGPHSAFLIKNGDIHQTAKGSKRVRLIQMYGGYEVVGPTVVAELTMEGHFTGHLYGHIAKDLHKHIVNPDACVRDVNALLDRAIRLERLDPQKIDIDKSSGKRMIYADPDKHRTRIVYVVEFFYSQDNNVFLPVYYFDACSNTVMFSYDSLAKLTVADQISGNGSLNEPSPGHGNHTLRFSPGRERYFCREGLGCDPSARGKGGNKKIGRRCYDTPPRCLPVEKGIRRSRCMMEGEYFEVVNNLESYDRNKRRVIRFRCRRGFRDAVNGAYGVANDAFFLGELTGRFFHRFLGHKALPDKSRIVVHFGRKYQNAFWSGNDMFFGDGSDVLYPLVSLDIIAHELAHGITRRHSNLLYRGQSGGINEAFSDISGAAAVSYTFGKHEWEVGSDIMKSRRGAIRYMNDPPLDGVSIKKLRKYRIGMNVHYSSGIFNYAFYRMVVGLGGSMEDAFASFYIANKLFWGALTGFRRGACNVMQASFDAGTRYRVVRKGFFWAGIPLVFCRKRGIWTTLFPGETRENILVSRNRAPILEINMSHGRAIGVHASTRPGTDPSVIHVVVATDDDAEEIIAEGDNHVKFPQNFTSVHVKLMSEHKHEVKVTLKVLN